MLHRHPSVARAVRALLAIVTVWCTGCQGFDPLVDAALETTTAAAPAGQSLAIEVADGACAECDCTSCHAVTLPAIMSAAIESASPAPHDERPTRLASVARTPAIPPPERAL